MSATLLMPIFQVHGHIKVNYSDAGRYMDYFSSARRRARLHIRIVSTQRGVRNVPLRCRQPSSPYNIGTGLTSARLRRRCRASFEPNRFSPMSDDKDHVAHSDRSASPSTKREGCEHCRWNSPCMGHSSSSSSFYLHSMQKRTVKYAMCRTERLTVLALTTARRYRIVTIKHNYKNSNLTTQIDSSNLIK